MSLVQFNALEGDIESSVAIFLYDQP